MDKNVTAARKQIFKYPLAVSASEVAMPIGAQVLTVQVQRGQPCLWALVDPKAEIELRRFVVLGTGHEAPEELGDYRGTFQLEGGAFVFHLFELAAS